VSEPRLVSLCPSITETLAEIGLGGRLVGVTRYCVRPREIVAPIPKVGGTKAVDMARIDELAPDVIFANAEENRKEDVEALSRRYTVHVSLPRTVSEIAPLVRELAAAARAPDAADPVAAQIDTLCGPGAPAGSFRYAYFIWKDPWMTVSGDTYVSDLFRYAGGINAFGDCDERYPEVTPAGVLARRPDVLFFSSEPYPFAEKHRPAIEAAFGKTRPIELVDGDDCCWHGARTRQGLKLMGELRRKFGKG
jgi:ABC-type Fe3+-hydroxamate transport system substrate-binding protein